MTTTAEPLVLEVVLHTVEACPDQATFLQELSEAVGAEATRGSSSSKDAAHNELWTELWCVPESYCELHNN
jgi:hypothetical protein